MFSAVMRPPVAGDTYDCSEAGPGTSSGTGYGPRGANSRRSLTFFRTDERLCIPQSCFEEGGITCLKFVSVQVVGRHRRIRVCGDGSSVTARCSRGSSGLQIPCGPFGAFGTNSKMTSGLFILGSQST